MRHDLWQKQKPTMHRLKKRPLRPPGHARNFLVIKEYKLKPTTNLWSHSWEPNIWMVYLREFSDFVWDSTDSTIPSHMFLVNISMLQILDHEHQSQQQVKPWRSGWGKMCVNHLPASTQRISHSTSGWPHLLISYQLLSTWMEKVKGIVSCYKGCCLLMKQLGSTRSR